MRERIWNNLANIKFKEIYTFQCSRLADNAGRIYSFILAFASTSSVAAWAIWERYPVVWALIVAASQIMHVAKPYFPIIKNDKEFLEMSFDFGNLYLEYERLWYNFENGKLKEPAVEERFYKYRQKEIEIEKMHKQAPCPHLDYLVNRSQIETNADLERNFLKGKKT